MKTTIAAMLADEQEEFGAISARYQRFRRRQDGAQTQDDELLDEVEERNGVDLDLIDELVADLANRQTVKKSKVDFFEIVQRFEPEIKALLRLLLIRDREAQRGRRLEGAEFDKARKDLETQPEVRQVLDEFPGSEITGVRQRVSA